VQYNECLAENTSTATANSASQLKDQIAQIQASVTNASVQLLAQVCQPTPPPQTASFNILAVRAEPRKAKWDWKLIKPPLQNVVKGATIKARVYYYVESAPANAQATIDVTLSAPGYQPYHDERQYTFCCGIPLTYGYEFPVTVKGTGQYTLSMSVTIAGQTHQGQYSFQVLNKVPKPKPVSLRFDNLALQNPQGNLQNRFTRGQPFFVQATYTVLHLKHSEPGNIVVTFVAPKSGKALFPPNPYGVTAAPGRQTFRSRFFTPLHSGSTIDIVVGLTLGGKTHQRSVTLSIAG
jgi:hypothetical protein